MSLSPSSPRRRQRADDLLALASGPLSAAESALSARSRPIPPSPDFHFYNSFPAFRSPTSRILSDSHRLLTALASSPLLAPPPSPPPDDPDDALPWLADLNDDLVERLGSSLDEFDAKRLHLEREMGKDGFQVVSGKKKKKGDGSGSSRGQAEAKAGDVTGYVGARVLVRDKRTGEMLPKVPFHLPNIPRPQDAFCILVNNSNQPFDHVWLEKSEDGTRFVHPLEKLSISDFVDRSISDHEPVKPQPLEDTPFKLVDDVKELKELAIKLRNANEFAVDLEHNQYRSFQGLTCLMQISTRTEDFVIDTLKLRIHIGPHLREVFKDPSKRKVMHGADRDILWLQRDFGIYVCNLFDTGQASRVLQLERNSLEYLLHHYCGIIVNKEYQNAEWRLRPVPVEMLKYAREDTHYLLYLYDLMRQVLLKASTASENGDALLEAYKRSYDVCMQLYKKELLTDTSYLYIYGLREADFNSQQLAVAAALCEWRDDVARAEDESTGYILPNRALLEIARQLPSSANKLRQLVKSKHSFVDHNIGPVVSIIKNAMHNAAAYECISEQLKKERLERTFESKSDDACKDLECNGNSAEASLLENVHCPITDLGVQSFRGSMGARVDLCSKTIEHIHPNENTSVSYLAGHSLSTGSFPELKTSVEQQSTASSIVEAHICSESTVPKLVKRVNVASIQVLKKPSGAFGALLGSSTSKQKPYHESRSSEMVASSEKLEQIKSSVILPFHSFSGVSAENSTVNMEPLQSQPLETQRDAGASEEVAKLDEIIPLGEESDDSPQLPENADSIDNATQQMGISEVTASIEHMHDPGVKDEASSLAELSFSFQKCFNTLNQSRSSSASAQKPKEFGSPLQLTPFDYSAARRELNSGRDQAGEAAEQDGEGLRSTRGGRRGRRGGETTGASFQPPRRSQAFPPTGNRNATFR